LSHGKNDFAEGFKILLDTENNFGTLKIMSNAAKNFDSPTKLLF